MDYTKINVVADLTDPLTVKTQPIFQLIKTLHGLSKILNTRIKTEEAASALEFIKQAYSKATGAQTSLFQAKIAMD